MSTGCDDDPSRPLVVSVDSVTISSATVGELDAERTYEFEPVPPFTVRPDSVLLSLWEEGLPISQAWLPLNYVCLDARGPRLTVELHRPADARMTAHAFVLGTGRLACSMELRRYVMRVDR